GSPKRFFEVAETALTDGRDDDDTVCHRTTKGSACRGHRYDSRPFRRRQGHTVAESNKSARGDRDALAWHQDARQIERVGSGNGDGLARGREVAQRPEGFYRHRQSELFPEKAADESSAADFAAILEPPQSDQQFAPSVQQGLAETPRPSAHQGSVRELLPRQPRGAASSSQHPRARKM